MSAYLHICSHIYICAGRFILIYDVSSADGQRNWWCFFFLSFMFKFNAPCSHHNTTAPHQINSYCTMIYVCHLHEHSPNSHMYNNINIYDCANVFMWCCTNKICACNSESVFFYNDTLQHIYYCYFTHMVRGPTRICCTIGFDSNHLCLYMHNNIAPIVVLYICK